MVSVCMRVRMYQGLICGSCVYACVYVLGGVFRRCVYACVYVSG